MQYHMSDDADSRDRQLPGWRRWAVKVFLACFFVTVLGFLLMYNLSARLGPKAQSAVAYIVFGAVVIGLFCLLASVTATLFGASRRPNDGGR
jgi:hypothetical protein